MTIKEIRAITGLSQAKFATRYGIPKRTVESWEAAPDKSSYRECPPYVVALLERAVREDYKKEYDIC